jgi:hypothetical protein
VEFRALILFVLAVAGQQPRVRVEVINTTKVHGLARRATRYLRDQGFDVVSEGTMPGPGDTTRVLDRTNHHAWAASVAHSLSAAAGVPVRVESRPDSSRYVDVTVLLGTQWHPPPQSFNP